jgi:GTP-binding protein
VRSPGKGRPHPPFAGDARFVVGATRPAELPPEGPPEIAFAGRSNVGKSSLLNRLLGRRSLARVSRTPGRTQQINFFAVGEALRFVDLPGYGFARVPLHVKEEWRVLVEHYLGGRKALRAVVVLIDARRGLAADDARLLDFLDAQRIASVLVATKIDKLKQSERRAALASADRDGRRPIPFSAATGEGAAELWGVLRRLTGRRAPSASHG